ncbi:MAG: type I DNA topoisomerase [Candidatus Omnitrophica bacterium]|nr:type I DNA topoisomerase [Candidatus Omnitrophota bacterium]
MKRSVVVVESPAKARTINKFLGKNYIVKSCMGHIVDLPPHEMGVDVDDDFKAKYQIIPGRKKLVSELKKAVKEAENLYLAQDPDREGEAISWHVSNLVGKGKEIFRVTFHEITRSAIEAAFKKPGSIDIKKVNAQQARRILDRLVGYNLSPLLWRKVGRGLSAGRVQSVALRLIVEREREIEAFVPEEYWEIAAELEKKAKVPEGVSARFVAKLEKKNNEKIRIPDERQAHQIIDELSNEQFIVEKIENKKRTKNPAPPFITSTLQQEAFNKLRFPAEKTMRTAQALYEGLEIGEEGSVGLITYMRTDSVRVSTQAQKDARDYILGTFGKTYLPPSARAYRSRKGAQEAHEAIRPTASHREPDKIKQYLTSDQYKLYNLIWKRFIASQMKSALYNVTTVDIKAGNYTFRAAGSVLLFDGFMRLYRTDEAENGLSIPPLSKKEELQLLNLIPSQHFTKPPARYTDASLVKALEQKGIGRPSTYAPIIHTIVQRDYIRRQGGVLIPTELGKVVIDLLIVHFPKLLNVKFTASLEEQLDKIEEGTEEWIPMLRHFYSSFEENLQKANVEMQNIKKVAVETDEVCSECGSPMVIKWSRRGRFLSCSAFPKCRFAKPLTTGVNCPQDACDGKLIERRNRRGKMFYGCSNYPKCTYIANKLPQESA